MEAIRKLGFEVSKSTCVLSCEYQAKEVVENASLLNIRICNLAQMHSLWDDELWSLVVFNPSPE